MKPVLLVPGVCGSRLEARSASSGRYIEDAWVSSKLTKPSYVGEAIMKYLWGDYESSTDLLYSYNKKVDIRACRGLDGCDTLVDAKLLHSQTVNKRNFAVYFEIMIQNFESIGYRKNSDLFAYTFDWRQPLYHPSILEPLDALVRDIHNSSKQKLCVVAHSMGGLLMLQYMRHYTSWGHYIDKLVCLGTPFDGASGYAILSATHGYNMRQPFRYSVFRGFYAKCPAILWLYPQPFHSLPIDSKVYFKLKTGSYPQYLLASSALLQMDEDVADYESDTDITWADVTLNPDVYGTEYPDSCFLILYKLQRSPDLVYRDLGYWITRLRRGCKAGAVYIDRERNYYAPQTKKTLERAARGRGDKILGKNFKYGIPTVTDLADYEFEWRSYGFSGRCDSMPEILKYDRKRPEELYKPRLDFKRMTRFSDEPDILNQAAAYQVYLEQNASLCMPPRVRNGIYIVKTSDTHYNGAFSSFTSSNSSPTLEGMSTECIMPGVAPWRINLQESCIYSLFSQMCQEKTLDKAVFGFDQRMLDSYARNVSSFSEIVYYQDFQFLSIAGSNLPTPLHMYFVKPVHEIYELAYQQPQSCYASGDSTVLLPSALSDPIPNQYVYDRIVIPGLQHLHMLYEETVFYLIKELLRK